MSSVFAGFILLGGPSSRAWASLAIGVAIDGFIVRLTIGPAVISLRGRGAWWLPRWLDRLPNVDIEGEGLRRRLAAEPGWEVVRV